MTTQVPKLIASLVLLLGFTVNLATAQIILPVGGNTFTNASESESLQVTNNGIENWVSASDTFTTYLRINRKGGLKLSVEASSDKGSILQVLICGQSKIISIEAGGLKWYDAGSWTIKDTGYIKIVIKGLGKTGRYFAAIKNYSIAGSAVNDQTSFVKNNDGNFYYWGRRGPSVHLNYPVDDSTRVEWFYNELTVPVGEDKLGSYFMANGFGDGYFGIQVNSSTERRILFSVWSPYQTDDPKTIPDSLRIRLLQKGEAVQTGEFGNEGSGGQSFLRYNWVAGHTYQFLIRAKSLLQQHTVYSAYFYFPEIKKWQLIASFDRPKSPGGLRHLHSFLENFIPQTGNQSRLVFFGNQWICDDKGRWTELLKARFTADNTARAGYRMDYSGAVNNDIFQLRNCGFFNDFTPINQIFTRSAHGSLPESVYLLIKENQ
ncbi:DUF3472 domain-containing protein [Flavihumibacter profundi]|jgi:hypothetical protein|uniref:DUF3472 domain-containing protein n=1 Tax=Flavihumibacter profundi TaxID=2716883 RepID=UPI001CC4F948|nr:DUF3472 domain-containing protein [Flavihumibacter profundi]MBZ5859290.1 DUF3472 domain-containing protein [Flavihumibacter profundi]